jgi:hypothetical protein
MFDDSVDKFLEFLSWQQIASFWSTYAQKNKRNEPLILQDNTLENISDDSYRFDANLQSDDDLIEQAADNVLQDPIE